EKFDSVFSLSVQVPEKTVFPSAKGKLGHRGGYPDIDPDIPRIGLVPKPSGAGTTARKEAGHIAIISSVDKLKGLVYIIHGYQTHHRSEDLGPYEFLVQGHVLQYGRRQKISFLISWNRGVPTIQEQIGTLIQSLLDQSLDPGLAFRRNYRPHI